MRKIKWVRRFSVNQLSGKGYQSHRIEECESMQWHRDRERPACAQQLLLWHIWPRNKNLPALIDLSDVRFSWNIQLKTLARHAFFQPFVWVASAVWMIFCSCRVGSSCWMTPGWSSKTDLFIISISPLGHLWLHIITAIARGIGLRWAHSKIVRIYIYWAKNRMQCYSDLRTCIKLTQCTRLWLM